MYNVLYQSFYYDKIWGTSLSGNCAYIICTKNICIFIVHTKLVGRYIEIHEVVKDKTFNTSHNPSPKCNPKKYINFSNNEPDYYNKLNT